jgi:hypothetical protein
MLLHKEWIHIHTRTPTRGRTQREAWRVGGRGVRRAFPPEMGGVKEVNHLLLSAQHDTLRQVAF